MREQERPAKPAVMEDHGARWAQQWVDLKKKNPSAKFSWYEHDERTARDWLLGDLKRMTQGHCAFCDAFPLDDRTTESIEHFRPKSDPRFLDLAYEWTNLYYCCGACQRAKLDQWDDALLCPDEQGYRFGQYFEFDYLSGEIVQAACASPSESKRAVVTIQMYDLNSKHRCRSRRVELRKWQNSSPAGREIDEWPYRNYLETSTSSIS
jgi:uncharacterized protein (TIGR02646 family)